MTELRCNYTTLSRRVLVPLFNNTIKFCTSSIHALTHVVEDFDVDLNTAPAQTTVLRLSWIVTREDASGASMYEAVHLDLVVVVAVDVEKIRTRLDGAVHVMIDRVEGWGISVRVETRSV